MAETGTVEIAGTIGMIAGAANRVAIGAAINGTATAAGEDQAAVGEDQAAAGEDDILDGEVSVRNWRVRDVGTAIFWVLSVLRCYISSRCQVIYILCSWLSLLFSSNLTKSTEVLDGEF